MLEVILDDFQAFKVNGLSDGMQNGRIKVADNILQAVGKGANGFVIEIITIPLLNQNWKEVLRESLLEREGLWRCPEGD